MSPKYLKVSLCTEYTVWNKCTVFHLGAQLRSSYRVWRLTPGPKLARSLANQHPMSSGARKRKTPNQTCGIRILLDSFAKKLTFASRNHHAQHSKVRYICDQKTGLRFKRTFGPLEISGAGVISIEQSTQVQRRQRAKRTYFQVDLLGSATGERVETAYVQGDFADAFHDLRHPKFVSLLFIGYI